MSTRIPAWRAIGLKLKGDGTKPEAAISFSTENCKSKSLHSTLENGQQADRSSKRRRLNLEQGEDQRPKVASNDARISEPPPVASRKKSVSFSQDTKVEDGDTRTTIDFPPGFSGSTSSQKPKVVAGLKETENSVKSSEMESFQKKRDRASAQKPKNALEYLTQFFDDRSSWKFNKNQDSWILSRALSTTEIPTSYNKVLCAYVHGLPAQAGARSRLISQCQEALSRKPGDGDLLETGSVGDTRKHGQALAEMLGDSFSTKLTGDLEAWLLKESRPVLLLYALGSDPVDDVAKTPKAVGETTASRAVPGKKNKKSRTLAIVDVSSSSDETSSDETSSQESSDEEPDRDSS